MERIIVLEKAKRQCNEYRGLVSKAKMHKDQSMSWKSKTYWSGFEAHYKHKLNIAHIVCRQQKRMLEVIKNTEG